MTNRDIVDQLETWLVDRIKDRDNAIENDKDHDLVRFHCGNWAAYMITLSELRHLRSQQDTDK